MNFDPKKITKKYQKYSLSLIIICIKCPKLKDLFSCSFMKLGGSGRLENKDIWKDSFVFGKCEEVRIVCQSQSLEEYINSRGIPSGQHFVFKSSSSF